MNPSVGRIVHYVSHGTPGGEYSKECRAAIITEVTKEHTSSNGVLTPKVGLCVLNPTGMFFNRANSRHAGTAFEAGDPQPALCGGLDYPGGTWHWPERV